ARAIDQARPVPAHAVQAGALLDGGEGGQRMVLVDSLGVDEQVVGDALDPSSIDPDGIHGGIRQDVAAGVQLVRDRAADPLIVHLGGRTPVDRHDLPAARLGDYTAV